MKDAVRVKNRYKESGKFPRNQYFFLGKIYEESDSSRTKTGMQRRNLGATLSVQTQLSPQKEDGMLLSRSKFEWPLPRKY